MTAAQEEVIEKAKALIREHFEIGVIAVSAEDDAGGSFETRVVHHGGFQAAYGLATSVVNRFQADDQARWTAVTKAEDD